MTINQLNQYLHDTLGRINRLQNNVSVPSIINNDSLTKRIFSVEKYNHWSDIERKVNSLINHGHYTDALEKVNVAFNYLETKANWIDKDHEPAFSNLAVISEIFTKIPNFGGFFEDARRNAHHRGIAKTEQRLNDINNWLQQLEDQLNPSLQIRMLRAVGNAF